MAPEEAIQQASTPSWDRGCRSGVPGDGAEHGG